MTKAPPIVLFDGVCRFCNGAVDFLLRHDKRRVLRFAPLQSVEGQDLLQQLGLPTTDFRSFVLVEGGAVYQRSTAALRLLPYLPWYLQWGRLGWLLPRALRDAVYAFVARNRYRWFGKRAECRLPTAAERERFLPFS